jgi:hypothetical protein
MSSDASGTRTVLNAASNSRGPVPGTFFVSFPMSAIFPLGRTCRFLISSFRKRRRLRGHAYATAYSYAARSNRQKRMRKALCLPVRNIDSEKTNAGEDCRAFRRQNCRRENEGRDGAEAGISC